MKRLGVVTLAIGILIVAATFSRAVKENGHPADLHVQRENRNPWTNLNLNNHPEDFRFAVVSDRTGGHRAEVFSRAVDQLNLLQPEFVVSVGDLIEGYTEDRPTLDAEWLEFQSFVCRLQMPFFYLPGNHDITNAVMEKLWQEKFGRSYYHFVYRNVLFLMLNSEDPPGGLGSLSPEQVAYMRQAINDNSNVRWTLLFLHKPIWNYANLERNGWLDIEAALGNRPYTVFAGHHHRYQKFIRNGRSYYQLATTGGISKMRGREYGEFDHIVWITMKKDGPVLANILLDGVYPEDMKKIVTDEPGYVIRNRQQTHPVQATVYYEGTPLPSAYVVFQTLDPKAKVRVRSDGITEADGAVRLSTYTAFDGVPAGDYAVTVVWRKPLYTADGQPGPNLLPERYGRVEHSGLKATVRSGKNEFLFELKKEE
ncbi:MAG: metallophosphoesterase [Gemmataceae bacterium]